MQNECWRATWLVAGLVWVAAGSIAQDVTPVEREQGLRYLAQTRNVLVDAVKGLTDEQWNFKPSPDRWSIAQVVQHLEITEGLVQAICQKLPNGTVAPTDRDAKQVDSLVLTKMPDRTEQFKAPPPLQPSGEGNPRDHLERFLGERQETIHYLKSGTDLRSHVFPHPVLGPLDGFQWTLMLAAHSERHTKQIEEVKEDPHFPVN